MVETNDTTEREPQEPKSIPVGWTSAFRIHPVSITIYVVLAGIVVLVIWRLTGYQPLQRPPGPVSPTPVPRLSRAYVLLGVYNGKLYFFDQQAESIVEYDPAKPREQKQVGSLPSIEAVVPAPNTPKIALVSTKEEDRTGIYVLDFSSPDELLWVTSPQAGFPSGYTLRSDSAVSWSPGDRFIAFVAYKNGQADLFVAQSDATRVQRLTYVGAGIGTVIWLDQQVIAFVSDWEGYDKLYLIDSDGGNLRRAR